MQGEILEEWKILCDQAANEQDPERLLELVRQIDAMLDEKRKRIQQPSDLKQTAA